MSFAVYTRSGWEEAETAMRVEFRGFPGFEFFSHRIENGYRVSEASTGCAVVSVRAGVPGTFMTRGEAIGAAVAALNKWGAPKLAETIGYVLAGRESATSPAAEEVTA